jgi:hypothetical protein
MTGYCDPPSGAENRWNAERCVALALERGEDLLLTEDDIDLAPDFAPALMAARRLSTPVTFWLQKLHNHPPEFHTYAGGALECRFERVRRVSQAWFGTQAILLPHEVLSVLATDETFGDGVGSLPFDQWLRPRLKDLQVAIPNPVQHRCPPNVRGHDRKRRVSLTYDAARIGSWEAAWQHWTTQTMR